MEVLERERVGVRRRRRRLPIAAATIALAPTTIALALTTGAPTTSVAVTTTSVAVTTTSFSVTTTGVVSIAVAAYQPLRESTNRIHLLRRWTFVIILRLHGRKHVRQGPVHRSRRDPLHRCPLQSARLRVRRRLQLRPWGLRPGRLHSVWERRHVELPGRFHLLWILRCHQEFGHVLRIRRAMPFRPNV